MMKKSLFALAIVILCIALIPIVGNRFMHHYIEKKMLFVQKNGLHVIKQEQKKSYLLTTYHYECILDDMEKLKIVPQNTRKIVAGAVLGVDIGYKNLLFARVVSLDFYPLKLSPSIHQLLEKKDKVFTQQIDSFLAKKGIFYHLEYNLLTNTFKGYMKDISQNYTLKDDCNITTILSGMTYKGEGNPLNAQKINSYLRELLLKIVKKDGKNTKIMLERVSSLSHSSTHHHRIDFSKNIAIDNLYYITPTTSLHVNNYKMILEVKDLNETTYRTFSKMDVLDEKSRKKYIVELFDDKFQVIVPEFSCRNIILAQKPLGGIYTSVNISMQKALEMDSNITLAKPLYETLLQALPKVGIVDEFAQKDGEKIKIHLHLKDKKFFINDKVLP